MPLFDPAVCGDVDPGQSAYVGLRHVVLLAHTADLFSHLAAAGEDPFVGWSGAGHPSTLTTT